MNTVQLNSTQRQVVAENRGLSSYLHSLDNGRPSTPRSWLYEDLEPKLVFDKWYDILVTTIPSDLKSAILPFEEQQIPKIGPQGGVPPVSEALETLDATYAPPRTTPLFKSKDWAKAKQMLVDAIIGKRKRTLRPKSFEEVTDHMRERDTDSTNSGWPRFTTRKKVRLAEIEDARSGKAYEYPAIVLFRFYNGKLRPVWMFPMSLNLIELSFEEVAQEFIREKSSDITKAFVTPWKGFEFVKQEITRQSESLNARMFGGDINAMDANFRRAHTEEVYDVIKEMFQQQYHADLRKSMLHIHDIELVVGPDAKIVGDHGNASGTGWTQFVETVFLMLLMFYFKLRYSAAILGQGIGDDLALSRMLGPFADIYVNTLKSAGLPANLEKQDDQEGQVTFLQRLFVKGFYSRENPKVLGAYYRTIRALNSLVFPEKFHDPDTWSSDMFCVRVFTILENTVDDPGFEKFVSYVVHGQKDLIPFAKLHSSYIDAAQKKSRMVPGLNPSYNQEKRDKPLSQFQAILYARTL